jgi:hypothetical protein
MLKPQKLSLGLAFFSGLLFALFAFLPLAQAEGLKVSPSITEQTVKPGEVLYKSIKVANESSETKRIYVYLRDFTADGEDGSPRLLVPGTEQGSFLSSWISANYPDGINIPAGAEQQFDFSISVPVNAGPGGYYGAIVFGTKGSDARFTSIDKGAASSISQQAGSLLLLQVPGETNESANVRDFNTDKSVYNTPFKIDFSTRIENQGNVHIKPRGVIEVSNMFDKQVVSIKINDLGSNILPKSIRRFSAEWSDKIGFGRYKAVLAMTYGQPVEKGGQGQQSLSYVTYFWIMPWKIIGYAGLIFFVLLLAVYITLNSYKKKAFDRAMKEVGGQRGRERRQGVKTSNRNLGLMMTVAGLLIFLLLAAVLFLLFA